MHKVITPEFWCDLIHYVVIAENCLKLKYTKFLPLNSDNLTCNSPKLCSKLQYTRMRYLLTIHEVFTSELCSELLEATIYMYEVLTSELCSELLKVVWYIEVKVVFPYVQWFTHSLVVVLEHPRVSTDLV